MLNGQIRTSEQIYQALPPRANVKIIYIASV